MLRNFVAGLEDAPRSGNELEKLIADNVKGANDEQRLKVCLRVIHDLHRQGWKFNARSRRSISVARPDLAVSAIQRKDESRARHAKERDLQLSVPSVARFVKSMERRRRGPNGWTSIFDLMRDGPSFAKELRQLSLIQDPDKKLRHLRSVINPYLQFVQPGQRCEHSGLLLMDIWRYFRYTWSIPHNSTPGRRMFVLVRDSAAPNHPVIGIAALGSAVVQLQARDRWIGWDPDVFLEDLRINHSARWARWLLHALSTALGEISISDFKKEKILTIRDIKHPDVEIISKLEKVSDSSRKRHQRFPNAAKHKFTKSRYEIHWKRQTLLPLFRAKRAEALAALLRIRAEFESLGFSESHLEGLRTVLSRGKGREAIRKLVRYVKARHIGINLADITVCGAVAPYNAVLGGKLVALLLASPEVSQEYKKRYSKVASVIASSVAGRAMRRPPSLVLLTTTSLYNINPSQYNRIKVPVSSIGGNLERQSIEYYRLGETKGFGSFHLSAETVRDIEQMLAQSHPGTRVNSIFGEGVSPRFRKIRAALDLLGLGSDALMQHGSSRIVFGIRLASNFKEVLLGLNTRPKYLLPQTRPLEVTSAIVEFWRKRWLFHRIERPEVLEDITSHTLTFPMRHGARVRLPEEASPQQFLFLENSGA